MVWAHSMHGRDFGNDEDDCQDEVENKETLGLGGREEEEDRDGSEEFLIPCQLHTFVHLLPEREAVIDTRVMDHVALRYGGSLLPVEEIEGDDEVQDIDHSEGVEGPGER